MDAVRTLMQNLSEQLDALSSRDRMLLTALASVLSVLIVGYITLSLQGVIADRANRVVLAKENLATAQDLVADLQVLDEQIAAAEARMGAFKPQLISSYLEQWASEANVPLKRADETGSQVTGAFKERTYTVEVQDATLDGVVRFLHAIETSPYPIKVRTADFDATTERKERKMALSLELLTYAKEG